MLGDDDWTLRDDSTLAVEEAADLMRERGLSAVRQFCFATGVAPHPRLADAWDVMIGAFFQTHELPVEEAFDGEPLDDASVAGVHSKIDDLLSLEGPLAEPGLRAATDTLRWPRVADVTTRKRGRDGTLQTRGFSSGLVSLRSTRRKPGRALLTAGRVTAVAGGPERRNALDRMDDDVFQGDVHEAVA